MPDESPALFGDALRRLAASATYLYQDGPRVWYSTQATVTKLADDKAELLKRDPDRVAQELEKRVRADLRKMGGFKRVHAFPRVRGDVPDDMDARLVVLGAEEPYAKEADSPAEVKAKDILAWRGNEPRLYQNTLVFLALDKARLQDLDEALRRFLAWESIIAEKEHLNLDPHQVRQAETQLAGADAAVVGRLPEAYQWLLVPGQAGPRAAVAWEAIRLSGTEPLAERAYKRLQRDESLIPALAPTILRKHLDDVPLWRGDHVAVRQLEEDFARYPYLPRLAGPSVVDRAVEAGLGLLTWDETFGYADSFDDAAGRYRGLRAGQQVPLPEVGAPGLVVKPDVASRQIESDRKPVEPPAGQGDTSGEPVATPPGGREGSTPPLPPAVRRLRRFHGSARLNATRVGRDAGQIAEEVIAHLEGLPGANVVVTIEIEATLPAGAPDQVVRTVTANAQSLKFTSQGFEEE